MTTNIVSAAVAYRNALKSIGTNDGVINKDAFKALFVNHTNYGKYYGRDFANHLNDGVYTTALKFKEVLHLVQYSDLWLDIPTGRAAQMGLYSAGTWISTNEDIPLEEALQLVKSTEVEANAIRTLWSKIGIDDKGYWYDEDENEETLYPMPPTSAVVAWLSR
jgi:hypothetical protein